MWRLLVYLLLPLVIIRNLLHFNINNIFNEKLLFSKQNKKLVTRVALFYTFAKIFNDWSLMSASAFKLQYTVLVEVFEENLSSAV